jgi:hypothetical protein
MRAVRRVLLACALLTMALPVTSPTSSGAATTFAPTRFDDPTPNGCRRNNCSLREAVIAANNRPGADVIALKRGTYELEIAGTFEQQAEQGDLDVRKPVTIEGKGMGATSIDGFELDRIFEAFGKNVTLRKLTVTGGLTDFHFGGGILNRGGLTLRNVRVTDNTAQNDWGGGVYNEGSLLIVDSRIDHNTNGTSCCGGGIYNAGNLTIRDSRLDHNNAAECCGGAIAAAGFPGETRVSISGSEFDHNRSSAGCCGGAIYGNNPNGRISITNSEFLENSVAGFGGGDFYLEAGTGTITRTELISGESERLGGSLYVFGTDTTLKLIRSRVANAGVNSCCAGGMRIEGHAKATVRDSWFQRNDGFDFGGGISAVGSDSKLTLVNSTVSENFVQLGGGGVDMDDGADLVATNSTITLNQTAVGPGAGLSVASGASASLKHMTIVRNRSLDPGSGIWVFEPSSLEISGSIVAANPGDDDCNSLVSTEVNLDADSTCFFGASAIHGNPRELDFNFYGGPTPTHKLRSSSPAVDAMSGSGCPPPQRDQRHVKRPRDGDGNGSKRCDLGAHER